MATKAPEHKARSSKPTAAEFAAVTVRIPSRSCETCVWLRRTPSAKRWLDDLAAIVKAGRYRGSVAQIHEHLVEAYGLSLSVGAFQAHVRRAHS